MPDASDKLTPTNTTTPQEHNGSNHVPTDTSSPLNYLKKYGKTHLEMVDNRTLITKSSTAMFMLGGTAAPILCAQAWEIPTWNMLACRSCRQRGLAASRTIFNVCGSSVESLLFSCTRCMSKGTHSGTQVCIGQCLQLFNGVPTVPHLHYSFRKDSQ
jgi:hypothetical protein